MPSCSHIFFPGSNKQHYTSIKKFVHSLRHTNAHTPLLGWLSCKNCYSHSECVLPVKRMGCAAEYGSFSKNCYHAHRAQKPLKFRFSCPKKLKALICYLLFMPFRSELYAAGPRIIQLRPGTLQCIFRLLKPR